MFKNRLLTLDFIFTFLFLFPLDFVQQYVVNASVIQINTYTDVDGFFLFLPYEYTRCPYFVLDLNVVPIF